MKRNDFKRIILVGMGASGKDHARNILTNILGFEYGVSYTTRPARENEVEGKDYHFVSTEKFQEMIDNDEWFEYVPFNGWNYGTTKEQFYGSCSLFIMTPSGLSHLSEKDRSESFVIYFEAPEKVRRHRMSLRKGNADSIERRLKADTEDFKDFSDYNIKVDNHLYSNSELIELVRKHMATKLVQKIED